MMQITTACLVIRHSTALGHYYSCTALGRSTLTIRDAILSTAINTLKKEAKTLLETYACDRNQPALNQWIYDPDWQVVTTDLFVTLPDRTVKARLPFIIQPFGSGFIAQSPVTQGMNLLIQQVGELQAAATEMLPKWIMSHKEWREVSWDNLIIPRDHWIEFFNVPFNPGSPSDRNLKNLFKLFSSTRKESGAHHLQAIGRCLDEELQDSTSLHGRQKEVEKIDTLLLSRKCQSIALIGKPGVGKSAIIREVVRSRVNRRSKQDRNTLVQKERVWEISSQRIVSGMMYLGQWEERWLGILREIHKRDHILVLEDPLGLLTAGKTRDSKLSAADVLTAFAAVHPIRIVTEMTPQALGILKVRKRELADMFLTFPIEPMKRAETLDLLIRKTGEIEVQRYRFFHPGTLPLIVSKTDRYFRSESFPGKAVRVVEDLCREREVGIAGSEILASLQKRTGLQLMQGPEDASKMERELKSRVVGQDQALDKLLQFLIRANAGLQPDDRPLGVFLCLGPTGVGKTETAKAIAEVMFEGESHLLRFDMNEINSSVAAEQLIGSFEQPDGKLTSAVRRQPFAVILLDEIEKAHPDVFDYLLQVIGEGRLTDAVGRTIDFRDTLILMTSNIGAREASRSMGFDISDNRATEHYRKAAADFFRPEFINRIDDILIFRNLQREHIKQIANMQLGKMIEREGIQRRKIFLSMDDDAMGWLIERGYDPQLGARVLKRELERFVAQPLADSLAEEKSQAICYLRIQRDFDRLKTSAIALRVKRRKNFVLPTIDATLATSRATLDSMHEYAETKKEACNFDEKLSKQVIQYYAFREQMMLCEEIRKLLDEMMTTKPPSIIHLANRNVKLTKTKAYRNLERVDKEVHAVDDMLDAIEGDDSGPKILRAVDLQWLLQAELEFAKVMMEAFLESDETLLYARKMTSKFYGNTRQVLNGLSRFVERVVEQGLGFEVEFSKEFSETDAHIAAANRGFGIVLRGLGSRAIAKVFQGLWLIQQNMHLLLVDHISLPQLEASPEGNDVDQPRDSRRSQSSVCDIELQKVLAHCDRLQDERDTRNEKDAEVRVTISGDPGAKLIALLNSDGLSLEPICSVPLNIDHPQINNLYRRFVLDWLLLDRCGVEVTE